MKHQIPGWVGVLIDWLPILLVFGVCMFMFYRTSKKIRAQQSASGKAESGRPLLSCLLSLVFIYLFLALFIWTAISAFSQPWTWTFYQSLFVVFVLGIAYRIARRVQLLRRRGSAANMERLREYGQAIEQGFSTTDPKRIVRNLILWIVAALVIVAVLNLIPSARH